MRIMIAGTGSGCGKTTVTCAVLAALKKLGKNVVSFKCGPDYIDPMFHATATQIETHTLDLFLMHEDGVRESLHHHSQNHDVTVIEGVMGLYDGIGQRSDCSSNHISHVTQTPVVLVVNPKGKSLSLCAELQGFLEFEPNRIGAVILNRVSEKMFPFYREMIESRFNVKVLGHLPDVSEARIESRHLGLVTAHEINGLRQKIDRLAEQAARTIDFDTLFALAAKAPAPEPPKISTHVWESLPPVNIYIAHDEAFCFHYEDNHRLLESMGARLRFFSPLHDNAIPDDADGLIFWGGYPELYAAALERNAAMKQSIRRHHERGMPIYAECGGFMYMQESLTDSQGGRFAMLGILKGHVSMTDRLQNFGYYELTANRDTILCRKGEKINAHSFHYSACTDEGDAFTAVKASRGDSWPCVIATPTLFAGYPHLHFYANKNFAENFIRACRDYRNEQNHGIHHEPR